MSEREEIYAAIFPEIQAHFDHSSVLSDLEDATWDVVNVLEDVIPAKPRTITTVDELHALPLGAVILDSDPAVLQMLERSAIAGAEWAMPNEEYLYASGEVTLPATVLWEPLP